MSGKAQAGPTLAIVQRPLGDALFSLGALAALKKRRPAQRLVLMAHPPLASLLRYAGVADEVWDRPSTLLVPPWRWVRRARSEGFEAALTFSSSRRAVLLAAASGARTRVGPARCHFGWLINHKMRGGPVFCPAEALDFVRVVDGDVQPASYEGLFRLPASDVDAARRLLSEAGLDAGAPYVVVSPGGHNADDPKFWPTDRFAEVVASLTERGWQVAVVGTAQEGSVTAEICGGRPRAANLAGRTSLVQLAAVLHGAELVMGNDSGPTHLAAALQRRTLTIFGPTNPELTRPQGRGHVVMRGEVPCAPCYRRPSCTKFECLLAVEPHAVVQEAVRVLGEASAPAGAVGEPHEVEKRRRSPGE